LRYVVDTAVEQGKAKKRKQQNKIADNKTIIAELVERGKQIQE
jgi:hypothetical protein